jgi:acetyl-CoA carboxylase carboxyltransferase component
MNDQDTPKDGVITGYGTIDGRLCFVYSQDAKVLGGSIGEMHAKKISGIYDMALKMGAPVIGLIDCAGLRLQEATDSLNAFGNIFAKQAVASGVIPQIQVFLVSVVAVVHLFLHCQILHLWLRIAQSYLLTALMR